MRKPMLAVMICVAACSAQAQTFAGKPFLAVQGHAETLVKPDIFPLEVTLREVGTDAAKAQASVENLAEIVITRAAELGVKDADIEVGNLGIDPVTKWNEKEEREIFLGNAYERKLRLRFRNLDALRKFIAAMPDSKALRMETATFEVSNAREIRRRLRREAIADARSAAAEMADGVGKKLLDLFNVSDRAQSTVLASSGYSSDMSPIPRDATSVALLAPGTVRSAGIVLREGEVKISADAYLVYVIGD